MPGRKHVAPLLTVLFALAAAGCGQRPVVQFNNTVATSANKIQAAVKRFRDNVTGGDQAVNLAEVKAAEKNLGAAVAEAKKEFAAVAVPSASAAKEVAEVFRRILGQQEEALKKEYPELIHLLEDPDLPPARRDVRIQGVLRPVLQQTGVLMTELQDAQQKFARENNISLKPPS